MLGIVVIGLLITLLVVIAFVAFAFFNVAFVAQPVRSGISNKAPGRKSLQWQPPLAHGEELRTWAADVSSVTTTRQLAKSRTVNAVKHLVADIHDGLMAAIAQAPNQRVQSKPNCTSSRPRIIGVTPPEAVVIAEAIRNAKSNEQIKRIRDVAARNVELTASLNDEQYEQSEVVCPLLESNDSCAVFDARPISCRSWCFFAGEDGNRCLLTEGEENRLDDHAHTLGQGVEEGLSRGLKSAGLDGTVYELNSALVAALDTPAAAERWTSGDSAFEQCKTV